MAAIDTIGRRDNIVIEAIVILPDHFHFVVDIRNSDLSTYFQKIKMSFGALYRGRMNIKAGRVWQHRFWDHIIRDQEDLNRHIDYIHYNPVKHGYTTNPCDWKYSSCYDYLKRGYYSIDWGQKDKCIFEGEYGE